MRILMVFDNYAPNIGGGEVLYQRLAEGLSARGHRIDVVTQRYPDTPGFEEMGGARIHRVRAGNRYAFTLGCLPTVLRLARDHDVIQTATYNSALASCLAGLRFRRPAVLTVHEVLGTLWTRRFEMNRMSGALHRAFERFVVSLPFSHIVCVSKATERTVRAVRRSGNVSVIHNGIDRVEFRPRPPEVRRRIRHELGIGEGDFVYLYYGRPGVSKGVEYLIEAIPLVGKLQRSSRPVLILAKEPADRYRSMLERIRNLGTDPPVRVLDPVPRRELPDYVGSADCVVVPSLSEGFGFTAVEACALAVPVVATRAGSLPEVVSGKVAFAEPASAASLASAIGAVMQGRWTEIPEKSFSWDSTILAYEALYEELVEGGKTPGR